MVCRLSLSLQAMALSLSLQAMVRLFVFVGWYVVRMLQRLYVGLQALVMFGYWIRGSELLFRSATQQLNCSGAERWTIRQGDYTFNQVHIGSSFYGARRHHVSDMRIELVSN